MNRAELYLNNAVTFSKYGNEMINQINVDRLIEGIGFQLLNDAAGQLEQAARELRRIEGYIDGKSGR